MADTAFRDHIRSALADENLQVALHANAVRRLNARQQAFSSLPRPWEEMRQRAHAVRAVVIANLDELLAKFIERAEMNGMTVLRAADGTQAANTILEIARQNGAQLVAKAKSMVSEEIGLNQILESAGLRVVETDLGEYIVQLRGEHPAHIITPAVHLRREQVGQTFYEKLGIPYTVDIPTLTLAARRVLRQVFLDAQIGLSGVNFGVVDSGTLCVVTNEGNGRMVTSLPKVHIALMGIERLVPSLDDLALMLYLLPRSATGQKLSVYTNLIHGPVHPDAPSGPQQRYLILLDNGRTNLRQSPLDEALYCIRCGACLNACPVFREIGGHAYVNPSGKSSPYSGPIGSVISQGLFGQDFGNLARASSLCGACEDVCPVGIDLPKLLLRVRAGDVQPLKPPPMEDKPGESDNKTPISNAPGWLAFGIRMYTWFATSASRFSLAQRLASFFGYLASPASMWMRFPAITGWGYSKDFPRPALKPFRARWREMRENDYSASQHSVNGESTELPPNVGQQSSDQPAIDEQAQALAPLAQFSNEISAVGGEFIRCREEELSKHVLDLLQDRDIRSILAWEEGYLPTGLLEELRAAGIAIHHEPDPEVRGGLTGASAAIAETGSLLVCEGGGRPLTASLLPEVHIAVIQEHDIYENLTQVLNLQEVRQAPSAVLITGPSRTADIEMTLTIGVHGPKELIVVCMTPQEVAIHRE